MYVFGGKTAHDGVLNDLWTITPGRDWLKLCASGGMDCGLEPPDPRHDHAAAVMDGTMYVFGGLSVILGGAFNDLWSIVPGGGNWTAICRHGTGDCGAPTAPPPRANTVMAAIGGSLYIYGGADIGGSPVFDDLWTITPTDPTPTWKPLCIADGECGPALPGKRRLAGVATIGDAFYVFGGDSEETGVIHNDIWQFNTNETPQREFPLPLRIP